MFRYLTQEWQDEVRALSQDQPHRPDTNLKIQYRITALPDGDLDYYWIIGEGRLAEAKLGEIDEPDFTITVTYENACKMQRGELEANSAFMQGKMRVAGNLARMMALLPLTNAPEWKTFQDQIRAITEY